MWLYALGDVAIIQAAEQPQDAEIGAPLAPNHAAQFQGEGRVWVKAAVAGVTVDIHAVDPPTPEQRLAGSPFPPIWPT